MVSAARNQPRVLALWGAIGFAVVIVGVLAVTGRLNLSQPPPTPPIAAVQCHDTDGNASSGWVAGPDATMSSAPVKPVAICAALYRDDSAVAQMDRIAAAQRALSRDCVTFESSDGGTWYLTGLMTSSPAGTYNVSGGPAPGVLPPFGQVTQPAPLVGIAATPFSSAGCVQLSTVMWSTAVPPMTACATTDDTVSVFDADRKRAACG